MPPCLGSMGPCRSQYGVMGPCRSWHRELGSPRELSRSMPLRQDGKESWGRKGPRESLGMENVIPHCPTSGPWLVRDNRWYVFCPMKWINCDGIRPATVDPLHLATSVSTLWSPSPAWSVAPLSLPCPISCYSIHCSFPSLSELLLCSLLPAISVTVIPAPCGYVMCHLWLATLVLITITVKHSQYRYKEISGNKMIVIITIPASISFINLLQHLQFMKWLSGLLSPYSKSFPRTTQKYL